MEQEQKGRDVGKSGVAAGSLLVCNAGWSNTLPPSRTRARSASAMCVVASALVLILGQG